jgi:excisionase family DNA binding protein
VASASADTRDDSGEADDRLLTAEQVAALLSVKRSWVYAEARAARIPFVQLGRYKRFRRQSVLEWVKSLEAGPP